MPGLLTDMLFGNNTQVGQKMGLLDYVQRLLGIPEDMSSDPAAQGVSGIVPVPKKKPSGLLGMGSPPVRMPKEMASQIDPIARIIISEAGGEGLSGMKAVANVIQNRVSEKGRGFAKQTTPLKVISAPDQFEGYKNKQYNTADKHPNWNEAKRIASQMLSGNLEDITGGATYYHNPRINPKSKGQRFFPRMVKQGVFAKGQDIGRHRFYKQVKDR
jgi:spore germination cell wall hydrolase CwlJ-like protein